jgi:hypothetical protein
VLADSLVFLTPYAALVGVAAVVPLAARTVAGRRVKRATRELRLPEAPRLRQLPLVVALVGVVALLALAAAQPAIRTTASARVRTDAQAFFVFDISRSMLAASSARSPTRLQRAKRLAIALRAEIPEVPSGVASLTDQALPYLFPDPDPATFDETVNRSVAVEQPPPVNQSVVATSLAALGAFGTQNYFQSSARRRLVVVLTDGESVPFDPREVARQLAAGPGTHLVLVHVWAPGEGVYSNGRPEAGYHENAASAESLSSLAAAAGGSSFSEDDLGGAIRAAQAAVGRGPTVVEGRSERLRTLAPYAALAALVPLVLVLTRGGAGLRRRRRAEAHAPAEAPAGGGRRPLELGSRLPAGG